MENQMLIVTTCYHDGWTRITVRVWSGEKLIEEKDIETKDGVKFSKALHKKYPGQLYQVRHDCGLVKLEKVI